MVQGLKATRKQAPSAPSHEVVHKPTGPVSTTTESISNREEEGQPINGRQFVLQTMRDGKPWHIAELTRIAKEKAPHLKYETISRAVYHLHYTGKLEAVAGHAKPVQEYAEFWKSAKAPIGRAGSMARSYRIATA